MQTPGGAGWAHRPSEARGKGDGPDLLWGRSTCEADEVCGGKSHTSDGTVVFFKNSNGSVRFPAGNIL